MVVADDEVLVITGRQVLWALKGWFRDAYLTDDGAHLVTGYDGLNLLQRDYQSDTTMLTFWRQGRKVRDVPLSEMIADVSRLVPTVSHYLWGHSEGIDSEGRFVVHTIENRRIAFDMGTGRAVENWTAAYPR